MSPQSSDAKAAVEARLGDCKYFKVSSFEKTNGIPIGNTDYQVEVKYTVSLTPGSDMSDRLKEDVKLFQQYQLIKADYSARKEELTKAFNTTMAAHNGDSGFDDAAANDQYRESLQTDPQLVKEYLPSLWMTFPRSLTTTPFERSSTGRFEACSCKPASGGLLPSLVQHHKLSLVFVTHFRPCASFFPPAVCADGTLSPAPLAA